MTRQSMEISERFHDRLIESWRAERPERPMTFEAWLDSNLAVAMYEGGARYGHAEFDQEPRRLISLPDELADYMRGYAEARGMDVEQLLAEIVADVAGEPCA